MSNVIGRRGLGSMPEIHLYNGHSFRIGAATTAAQRGLEDSLIQTLGRWKSAAYKLYIKLPRTQLASVSRVMACPPQSAT